VSPAPVGPDGRSVLVLPADRYRVTVGLPGAWSAMERARGVPDHDETIVLAPGEVRRLTVRPAPLHALGTIAVHVKDSAGVPVVGHEVWLIPGDAGTDWCAKLTRRTDGRGCAEFPELAKGRYKLQGRGDISEDEDAIVTLEGARAETGLVVIRVGTVSGVVRGPNGEPVAGAEVGVVALGGGSYDTVRTDAEGRFSLEGAPLEGRVVVSAAGFLHFHGEAGRLDGPVEVTLTIDAGLTVRGSVPAGVPDGTRVSLTFEGRGTARSAPRSTSRTAASRPPSPGPMRTRAAR
jgi:hypothetical protein